jgi:hypothetical protein
MSRFATALTVLALIGVLVAVGIADAKPVSTTTAQIRQAEQTLLRATVANDSAAVGRLIAPDFQLIDPFGSTESKSAYLGTINGGVDFKTFKPISAIQVRALGSGAAVARFQAAFDVLAGPDHLKHRGWVTDLFEYRNGRWLEVWSQITPTPNNPDLLVKALTA